MDLSESKDQLCMNCGVVMLSNARLDEAGHISVNTLTQIEFEQVENDLYIKCQKCNSKNCVELVTGSNGHPQLIFTHVKG